MKQISFFDLDHTLFRVNSSFSFGNFLYQNGIISLLDAGTLANYYAAHKLFGIFSIKDVHKTCFNTLFKNKSELDYQTLIARFLDQQFFYLINPAAHEALKHAKNNNHHTYLLSSSPEIIVSHVAKRFAMDGFRATIYEIGEKGEFESVGRVLCGNEKAKEVVKIAQTHDVSLENTWGYSDSHHDIPFLSQVGHAIAVNPSRKLSKYSRLSGWQVLK